jgi:hypothetical protein
MTSSEKLKVMRVHFASLGISPITGAPRIWRALWFFGVPVPPLVFLRFASVALITGGFAAVSWGLFMWFIFWSRDGESMWGVVGLPLLVGALFGFINAKRARAIAHTYNFPLWADYKGPLQS